MAEGSRETESNVGDTTNANATEATSLPPESEFSAVIFSNVSECYPPERDIECRYKIKSLVKPNSRDWIGLFKVGWQSSRDHYTYEWSPLPDIQNGEQGKQVCNRVVFRVRYLPKADDEFYQFCYVTSAGDVRGASVPFQIKTKPFEQEELECCEIEDDEGSSIMIVKNKTAILEESLGQALEENAALKASKETVEADLAGANEEIMRLGVQNVELTTALKESEKKSTKLEEMLTRKTQLLEAEQSSRKQLESTVSDLNTMHENEERRIKELMMVVEQQRAQTSAEVEKNKEKLVIERKQYVDTMTADRQMIEKLQKDGKAKEEEIASLKTRVTEFKTKAKSESVEFAEKLETLTSANGRLQDQLVQITSENGMLKRSKEEESDRFTKRIRDAHLELKNMDRELQNMQKEIEKYRGVVADLERAKEEILHDASQEAELLGNKIEKLRDEGNEKQELIYQLERELEDVKTQLIHEKGKATALEEDYESAFRALQDQLEGEKALNQSLCSQSDRNFADLQGQVQKQLEANMELTAQLEGRKAEIRDLCDELDDCKKELHAADENARKAWRQISAADAEVKSLMIEKETLQSALADTQGASMRSSKNSAASMYALQTAHAHLEKNYLKIKKEQEELWRERNDLKRSVAALQGKVSSDDIRLQVEELRANNEDLRVRLNMGAEAYKMKFIECRQLEAKLNKLRRSSSVEALESSSILEMQPMILKLQKALDEEKEALVVEKNLVLMKNEEINQLNLEISELKEKVKHTEQMELQKADHAQSQLIVEELLGKVASLERNLEVEKKEKESIIHEILNLQVDLRKKEGEMDIYKETLKVTEGALTKEQNERELLGEQARQRLQECQENEKKLDLKVKELTAEVERWKKEVDLHVEAEARLMENRSQEEVASSEQAKPENNQQPSPAPGFMPVRGCRPFFQTNPAAVPGTPQPWVFVQHPAEGTPPFPLPAVPPLPQSPPLQPQQPSAPPDNEEVTQCPVCKALLPPSVNRDEHVNSHFD